MADAEKESRTALQRKVAEWWVDLTREERRGQRAVLRRAKSLEEVVLAPAFHHLRHALAGSEHTSVTRIALVAGVLAHLDENDTVPVAARMAQPAPGTARPRVSELRFRRLLQAREPEELLRAMRRLLGLLGSSGRAKASVDDLTESVYWWSERTRRQWALDFYDSLPTQ